ncbi:MAG: hypothetical protein E6J91_30170 [Deltaproteobacteria bacterium]|nr:MAG: hypothetical protein E6J91_30170 [Deltaproteobacteria bacterium]
MLSLLISLIFAWRSFYAMRIGNVADAPASSKPEEAKPAKTEAEAKTEAKAEGKVHGETEAKTEAKPDAKTEAKPDAESTEASV